MSRMPWLHYSPATTGSGRRQISAGLRCRRCRHIRQARTKELAGVRLLDPYTYSISDHARTYANYYFAMNYASLAPLYLPLYGGEGLTVKDDGNGAYLDGGELTADGVNASRYVYEGRVVAGPYMIKSLDTGALTATLEINPNYNGNFEGAEALHSDDRHRQG